MKLSTRILLSFILVVGVGFYFLVDYIVEDLRPRYLEAVEESLVDQANILAVLIEAEIEQGDINTESFGQAFNRLRERPLEAQIYNRLKTQVDQRVYVTDSKGKVVFDSEGKAVGQDFSEWNDVYLTLRGQYGARSSREKAKDPTSSVLHVGAPIYQGEQIIGVVTVRKPTVAINEFIQSAEPKIFIAGTVAALGVILLAILFSMYFNRPINQLTRYARAVRDGRVANLPKLRGGEVAEMGQALEQMREALEGKKYVERYVQTLTHELKSPIAAIQGAVEILQGGVSDSEGRRFLNNIQGESKRMESLVERLLELAALESRGKLSEVEVLNFSELLRKSLERWSPILKKKQLILEQEIHPLLWVKGDAFLLEHLISNLIQNAYDFSPPGKTLKVNLKGVSDQVELRVVDEGSGIPDYAKTKIFNRFYSLARPESGKKSSGLGLSFVKEVTLLHGGQISLKNLSSHGVEAFFSMPKHKSPRNGLSESKETAKEAIHG